MELMFCMLINMKVIYNFILLFLMDLAGHAQSNQLILQYLPDILRKQLGMKLRT